MVKNWYKPKGESVPKVFRKDIKCISCGKDCKGSSNFNKHVRNIHRSHDYNFFKANAEPVNSIPIVMLDGLEQIEESITEQVTKPISESDPLSLTSDLAEISGSDLAAMIDSTEKMGEQNPGTTNEKSLKSALTAANASAYARVDSLARTTRIRIRSELKENETEKMKERNSGITIEKSVKSASSNKLELDLEPKGKKRSNLDEEDAIAVKRQKMNVFHDITDNDDSSDGASDTNKQIHGDPCGSQVI